MDATTVAIDLAKDVFQVAISTHVGVVSDRRRLNRRRFALFVESLEPGTTVVMETCSMAHYWGRRCQARGAVVRLLPAQYVRPYVRRDKTDRADAEALLEAHRCGAIHPVPVKTTEQQTLQSLHRLRQQWQTTRTARVNLLRAVLGEHGFVFPAGAVTVQRRIAALVADPSTSLPALLRTMLSAGLDEVRLLEQNVARIDRQLAQLARQHPVAQRLQQIPGVGVITSTALVGSVPHIHSFRRGRQFASWLGLTPRESSSGHRRSLGHISKRRHILALPSGARRAIRLARRRTAGCATRWARHAISTLGRPHRAALWPKPRGRRGGE